MTASNFRQQTTDAPLQLRRYGISYLTNTGDIADRSITAPAIPAFEDAFAALGRGAILETPSGQTAVEDLQPGDQVRLADGHFATILWRGAITLRTGGNALTRVAAGALGARRPLRDLVLGPAARLYHCTRGANILGGKRAAYVPACDYVDGDHFVALRPAVPVDLYQIGFASHETLLVNGIGVESLHTGTAFSLGLHGDLLDQYLSLFPHLDSFSDMGLFKYPRLRLRDLDLLD